MARRDPVEPPARWNSVTGRADDVDVAAATSLTALCESLGHRFQAPNLLIDAITHVSLRSSGTASAYQRMEFLGDRVLGVVVADMLYHRFPGETEGALAKRHAALVRREALAEVAGQIGLGAFIRVAGHDANQTLLENPAVLADCCEAVIAALYSGRWSGDCPDLCDALLGTVARGRSGAAERPENHAPGMGPSPRASTPRLSGNHPVRAGSCANV